MSGRDKGIEWDQSERERLKREEEERRKREDLEKNWRDNESTGGTGPRSPKPNDVGVG